MAPESPISRFFERGSPHDPAVEVLDMVTIDDSGIIALREASIALAETVCASLEQGPDLASTSLADLAADLLLLEACFPDSQNPSS